MQQTLNKKADQLELPLFQPDPDYQDLAARLNALKIYGSDRWAWNPDKPPLTFLPPGAFTSPDVPYALSWLTAEELCSWWEARPQLQKKDVRSERTPAKPKRNKKEAP